MTWESHRHRIPIIPSWHTSISRGGLFLFPKYSRLTMTSNKDFVPLLEEMSLTPLSTSPSDFNSPSFLTPGSLLWPWLWILLLLPSPHLSTNTSALTKLSTQVITWPPENIPPPSTSYTSSPPQQLSSSPTTSPSLLLFSLIVHLSVVLPLLVLPSPLQTDCYLFALFNTILSWTVQWLLTCSRFNNQLTLFTGLTTTPFYRAIWPLVSSTFILFCNHYSLTVIIMIWSTTVTTLVLIA